MAPEKVNLAQKLDTFSEHWSPKVVGALNGQHVKIAKLQGEFVMHHHEQEDELFYVIDGQLFIEFEDNTIELNTGEFIIVPKGIPHKPYAPKEVSVLLFEPATTLNTGNLRNNRTVEQPEQL